MTKGDREELPGGLIERDKFEDEYPVMFKFYSERGRLNESQHQKVQEIQQRWKQGFVFWLTHDNREVEIPEWVAVNVVVNNRQSLGRSSRICMSLNHTKGYGCNRLAGGLCTYVHECALCGSGDHGVFQKRADGSWVCAKLGKWHEEEDRYQQQGFGDPRKHEESLTELAKKPRSRSLMSISRKVSSESTKTAWPIMAAAQRSQPPAPQGAGRPPAQADLSKEAVQGTEEHQDVPVVEVTEDPKSAPPSAPPPPRPPRLPADWSALWCEERKAYYYWHLPTNETTWQRPPSAAETTPVQRAEPEAEQGVASPEDACAPPRSAGVLHSSIPGERRFICTQHWAPTPGLDHCMRILKGEILRVTWADEKPVGWAYATVLEDASKAGYVPWAALAELTRDPFSREVGRLCSVAESFLAPQDEGGYLSVRPGETLRVIHPMESFCVWAYVERVDGRDGPIQLDRGWVPEFILGEVPPKCGRERGRDHAS